MNDGIKSSADASGPLRVLGIDPGLNITGYGVIEFDGAKEVTVR